MGSGNGLPEHLSGETAEVNIKHNWLYSVIPADREVTRYSLSEERIDTISEIYLVGYCKNCNTAFTAPVPYSWSRTVLTDMAIPKDGCSGSNI